MPIYIGSHIIVLIREEVRFSHVTSGQQNCNENIDNFATSAALLIWAHTRRPYAVNGTFCMAAPSTRDVIVHVTGLLI